jgi:hypothetical protein
MKGKEGIGRVGRKGWVGIGRKGWKGKGLEGRKRVEGLEGRWVTLHP